MGFEKGLTTVLGSTHVVEQLSFSMFPSTLAFDFDLMLGSFFTFWIPNGLFWASFLSFWGLQKMLQVCETYAKEHNLVFSTDPVPAKSKSKCLYFVVGREEGLHTLPH